MLILDWLQTQLCAADPQSRRNLLSTFVSLALGPIHLLPFPNPLAAACQLTPPGRALWLKLPAATTVQQAKDLIYSMSEAADSALWQLAVGEDESAQLTRAFSSATRYKYD